MAAMLEEDNSFDLILCQPLYENQTKRHAEKTRGMDEISENERQRTCDFQFEELSILPVTDFDSSEAR